MAATVKIRKLHPVDGIKSISLPLEMLLADFEQMTGLGYVELEEHADSVASR